MGHRLRSEKHSAEPEQEPATETTLLRRNTVSMCAHLEAGLAPASPSMVVLFLLSANAGLASRACAQLPAALPLLVLMPLAPLSALPTPQQFIQWSLPAVLRWGRAARVEGVGQPSLLCASASIGKGASFVALRCADPPSSHHFSHRGSLQLGQTSSETKVGESVAVSAGCCGGINALVTGMHG